MRGSRSTRISHRCPACGHGPMSIDEGPRDYVSECPECGYTCVFKSDLVEHNAEARARRLRERGGALAAAGVPALFHDVEPDKELARRILETGKGLYLQGGNGTYKTLKAASVAKAFVERGMAVRFVSSAMLMSGFRDAMGGGKTEERLYAELNGCELLVIDDLGKENPTTWASTLLFTVIDGRYGSGRWRVVVTSNYSKAALADRLAAGGDESAARAIVSRLFEMTEKIDLGNNDARRRGRRHEGRR